MDILMRYTIKDSLLFAFCKYVDRYERALSFKTLAMSGIMVNPQVAARVTISLP